MKTKIIYKLDDFGFVIFDSAKKIYSDPRTKKFGNYDGFIDAEGLPELKANQGVKLVNGQWEILPDYRGAKLWNKETKEEHKIEEPEVQPDFDKYTLHDPSKVMQELNTHHIKYSNEVDYWIIDIVAKVKADAEAVISNRAAAYREESDPVFFKYQRGEASKEEWLKKVQEIRERFPKAGEAKDAS